MEKHQYIPMYPTPALLAGLLVCLMEKLGGKVEVYEAVLARAIESRKSIKASKAVKKDAMYDIMFDQNGEPVGEETLPLKIYLVDNPNVPEASNLIVAPPPELSKLN